MTPAAPIIFLLSSVFLLYTLATVATASDPVLDTDGNELTRGTEYYILQSPGIGGGLGFAARNGTCPLYVAKESSEVDMGLPVSFYPANEGEDTVRLSTDANFVFNAFTICIQSSVWELQAADEATGRYYVSTGGSVGNPGRETLSNWFKIAKVEGGEGSYKLVFCPGVCNTCRPICGDLGLFVEDGSAWLGIGGSPLSVVFKKA